MIYSFLGLTFLAGLAAGSFLNCVIYRLSVGETFVRGSSYCPHCRHKLSWRDLIPLLSFVFLRGRCRYCRQMISVQYPLVELGTALLFVLVYLRFFKDGGFPEVSLLLLISCCLIVIFVYDLRHYIIPDAAVYPAVVLALLYQFIFSSGVFQVLECLFSAFGAAGFFFLIWFFSKGKWLGFGDVKLVFLMGLLLGFPNILTAVFLAFFIGAIIGVGLIVAGRKRISSQVPFGPFLVFGTFLSLFLGQDLIGWYSRLFL